MLLTGSQRAAARETMLSCNVRTLVLDIRLIMTGGSSSSDDACSPSRPREPEAVAAALQEGMDESPHAEIINPVSRTTAIVGGGDPRRGDQDDAPAVWITDDPKCSRHCFDVGDSRCAALKGTIIVNLDGERGQAEIFWVCPDGSVAETATTVPF